MFDHHGLILGGNLNLTLADSYIWVVSRLNDPLHGFFNSYFEQVGLIDIEPLVLSLTWNNDRLGNAGISKRLHRFFMVESLCDSLGSFRTWHVSTGCLDQRATVLELDKEKRKMAYPFKFNIVWLEDASFYSLVRKKWQDYSALSNLPPMMDFLKNLSKLGIEVKNGKREEKMRLGRKRRLLKWKLIF